MLYLYTALELSRQRSWEADGRAGLPRRLMDIDERDLAEWDLPRRLTDADERDLAERQPVSGVGVPVRRALAWLMYRVSAGMRRLAEAAGTIACWVEGEAV